MCTVTYLPTHRNGFILTHSRDEQAIREPALSPQAFTIGGKEVYFPQDPQGKGSWIATSATQTICLLNGAYTAHRPQPPYKHSRGLVLLHFFGYASLDHFIALYDFEGIEPFTLIMVESERLAELRWNGKILIVHEKDCRHAYIWSSATLYTPEVIARRAYWFRIWLRNQQSSSVAAIRRFHKTAGDGDETNDLLMNRNNQLFTISLTSVASDGEKVELFYEDLVTQMDAYLGVTLHKEPVALGC